MPLNEILLIAIEIGSSVIVRKVGREIQKKLSPPIEKARKSAIEKMAKELGSEFPSLNFLEMNFRFDSTTIKSELSKLTSEGHMPDENIIKREMAREVLNKWPEILDINKAEKILNSFLKHFELECLTSKELQGLTLASIIRKENTVTQEVVLEEVRAAREDFMGALSELNRKVDQLRQPQAIANETITPEIISTLEQKLIKERDEIVESAKRWQYIGLHDKVEKLANEVFIVRKDIKSEIAASIFRLCGSLILRTTENRDKAGYWIKLAEEEDPENHKTIALKAELLCSEKNWPEAKKILDPIADSTKESFVKVIYAECLYHISGSSNTFEWLEKQKDKDDEINLNLAIFAIKDNKFDYAFDILKHLKEKPNPGPYPYLYTAEILVKRATPRELINISTAEDLELKRNKQFLLIAAENLKEAINLLTSAARPAKVIAYTALSLSEIYIRMVDFKSAEKYLCQHWRQLRSDSESWFTASSISFLKKDFKKALVRAQKALDLSTDSSIESILRFALLCINIREWDKCLETIETIDLDGLGEEHLKAVFQMRVICYLKKEDFENAEQNIQLLNNRFPKDEMWVIFKAISFADYGRIDEAIDLLIKEKANYSDSLEIKLRLASLYWRKKEYPNALALYKEIATLFKNISSYEYACKVAFEANKPDEVLPIIEDAENNGIFSENLKHFKAFALTMSGLYDEALNLFLTFHEDSLTNDDYYFYAFCHAKRANQEKAIDLLEKAKGKYPDDVRIVSALCRLYIEIDLRSAFNEAKLWLQLAPEDKTAYFAVIQTGFAIGEALTAHQAMIEYLSRFDESPDFRRVDIDEIKEMQKESLEHQERLWKVYQEGLLPEIILSHNFKLGVGSYRIMLLESPERIMAFDGNANSQKRQLVDTLTAKDLLIDYHALITIYLLDLIEPTLDLFEHISIPEIVIDQIRVDLSKLYLSYQQDIRSLEEKVFSRLNSDFKVNKAFPQINPKDISESLGYTVYDLEICKALNGSYVTPGYEQSELLEPKSNSNVDVISVLDFVDLMKEKGIILVKKHEDTIKTLQKYDLKRLSSLESISKPVMFHWNALNMLEECKILEDIPKLVKDIHIGPFSYALMQDKIENYKRMDNIKNKMTNIQDQIKELLAKGKVEIITSLTKETEDEEILGREYIEDLKNICKEKKLILWTDDLTLKLMVESAGIKTTCTRTILDVLLQRRIISKSNYVEKIVQLLKWNMYFCWINADVIFKCAEMYDYSMNEDLEVLITSLTSEMQNYLNQIPNNVEYSNFNVVSTVILKLWFISEKAQSLAMKIFDEVHSAVKSKDVLNKFWIQKCILDFALLEEVPLRDFLTKLSIRMPGLIYDDLKEILMDLIKLCLANKTVRIVQAGDNKFAAANIINAIKYAIPSYTDEIRSLAIKLDPSINLLV